MDAGNLTDFSSIQMEHQQQVGKRDDVASIDTVLDEGVCAICLERIPIQDCAAVKGCGHSYCAICILRWATYTKTPLCPQCKLPFTFLDVYRSLDGSIHDYSFEESVCLLLRAPWFVPLSVETEESILDESEDISEYYDDERRDDDLDEAYFMHSQSNIRVGNRRWGDNGYVRSGRKEARPVIRQPFIDNGAGPSQVPKKKEATKDMLGRRAKRALKREAADKAAAVKHQQHLQRLGQK
ncbi:putative transcription factor C2H2 family [Dioscorea sansibarensis]